MLNKSEQISYGNIKPETFIDLKSGYYYYNYNIQTEEILITEYLNTYNTDSYITENNSEYINKYTFIQVRINGKPTVNKCYNAILESYVNKDGTSLLNILSSPIKTIEDEQLANDIFNQIEIDFGIKEKLSDIEIEKQKVIRLIDIYDTSSDVNSFFLNGLQVWLDKATRVGLMNSLNVEQKAGRESSILWFGNIKIKVNTEIAIQMLSALELYALECYNKTAEHKSIINDMNNINDIINYDYTQGYPDKLEFNVTLENV